MNVFAVVKENVTARQVAMQYGIKINRSGLACCPFHKDKTPSMKIDKRYYCFGCGDTGDAIDFVAKYFGLAPKEAAMKIAPTMRKDQIMIICLSGRGDKDMQQIAQYRGVKIDD